MSAYRVYYVLDPMCSWCWAFAPAFGSLRKTLEGRGDTDIRYVMGGLAHDSDAPMPGPMREHIQEIWREIASRTGARFNHTKRNAALTFSIRFSILL